MGGKITEQMLKHIIQDYVAISNQVASSCRMDGLFCREKNLGGVQYLLAT
jgi:hypothetical protein